MDGYHVQKFERVLIPGGVGVFEELSYVEAVGKYVAVVEPLSGASKVFIAADELRPAKDTLRSFFHFKIDGMGSEVAWRVWRECEECLFWFSQSCNEVSHAEIMRLVPAPDLPADLRDELWRLLFIEVYRQYYMGQPFHKGRKPYYAFHDAEKQVKKSGK